MSQPLAKTKHTGAFDIETAPRSLVGLGRGLALLACVVAPWAFGCIRFREARWFYAAIASALILGTLAVLIRSLRAPQSGSLRVPLLLFPMFAGIALGAAQLLPISQTLTGSTVEQVPELEDVELGAPISSTAMSFHPTATRLEISRYSFAIAAFLVGYTLFRTPQSQRLLWAVMLLNGVALVAFGLIQRSTWNGKLFWTVPLRFGGDPFASFVNRNNAMAFIFLAAAGGVGLLVWAFERKPLRATTGLIQAGLARLATIDAMQVVLLLAIATLAGGVVASTSRSGVLSFAVASFVVLVVVATNRKALWPLALAVIAVTVAAGVVYSLQLDKELTARIAKLNPEEIEARSRVLHAKDALKVLRRVPITGAGLGSHRYAHLPFVSELGRRWAVNADNQYVEVAVEGGTVGLAIALLLVLLATRVFWVSRGGFPEISGTAAALLFLLSAQTVHAIFDYGIILPATICGMALLVGAFVAAVSPRTSGRGASIWAGRFALPLVMLVTCGLAGFGFTTTANAAQLEIAQDYKPGDMSDQQLDAAIANADAIPGADAKRWHAELLIERYERSARAEIRKAMPKLDEKAVMRAGSFDKLYTRMQEFRRREQTHAIRSTLGSRIVSKNLEPALASLKLAVAECPVLPDSYNMLGQLSGILEPDAALPAFKRAVLVEPMQDKAVGLAGCNLMEVRSAESLAHIALRHSMNTPRWRVRREIIAELNGRYGLRYLVSEICPTRDAAALAFVLSLDQEKHTALAQRVLRERGNLNIEPQSIEDCLARAEIYRRTNQSERMTASLRNATDRYPGSAEVRHQLAQALLKEGDLPAALLQSRAACAIEPGNASYAGFLQSLEDEIERNRSRPRQTCRDIETQMMHIVNVGRAGRGWI